MNLVRRLYMKLQDRFYRWRFDRWYARLPESELERLNEAGRRIASVAQQKIAERRDAESRCNWCGQDPNTDSPRMAVEAHFIVRGDTEEEVVREIRSFESWLYAIGRDGGAQLPQGWVRDDGKAMQGFTTDGRRSVAVYRRDVTPEQYRAEVGEWLVRQRKATS